MPSYCTILDRALVLPNRRTTLDLERFIVLGCEEKQNFGLNLVSFVCYYGIHFHNRKYIVVYHLSQKEQSNNLDVDTIENREYEKCWVKVRTLRNTLDNINKLGGHCINKNCLLFVNK